LIAPLRPASDAECAVRILAPAARQDRTACVLALQRRVGNRAVTRLLARSAADDAKELEGVLEVAGDIIEQATGSRPPPGTPASAIQNQLRRIAGRRGAHAEQARRVAQQIQEIRNRAKFVPKAKLQSGSTAAKAEEKAAESVIKTEEKAAQTVVKAEEKATESVVKMEGKAAETVTSEGADPASRAKQHSAAQGAACARRKRQRDRGGEALSLCVKARAPGLRCRGRARVQVTIALAASRKGGNQGARMRRARSSAERT
jgi:hypothetical protein